MAASRTMVPPGRPSRPTTTMGRDLEVPRRATKEPNAAANPAATAGEREAPTMPRQPETESMRGALDMGERVRRAMGNDQMPNAKPRQVNAESQGRRGGSNGELKGAC